jgi:hypothetical protein
MKILAVLAAAGVLTATPLQATLSAPTHTPKAKTKWWYTVRASSGGKPVAARVTAEIVDLLGSSHPVAYDGTKKPITNRPFRGTFRDYVIWPPESRGFKSTLRITVKTGSAKKVLTYAVTPR